LNTAADALRVPMEMLLEVKAPTTRRTVLVYHGVESIAKPTPNTSTSRPASSSACRRTSNSELNEVD
jgi:hypothetical protein